MSNAHANSTTPHRIGQITKAEILIAHLLDTAPAGTDHQRQAAVIVQQLQDAGWKSPPDPNADLPPLRPVHAAPTAVAEAALAEGREAVERKRGHRPELGAGCTCRTCRPDLATT